MSSHASTSEDEKTARLVTDSPENMSEVGVDVDVDMGEYPRENGMTDHGELVGQNDDTEGSGDEEDEEEDEDGEEYEDEDVDEDEDEDADEEPALKYERFGGSVHDLLQKDSASALAYSQQQLVRRCPVSARK